MGWFGNALDSSEYAVRLLAREVWDVTITNTRTGEAHRHEMNFNCLRERHLTNSDEEVTFHRLVRTASKQELRDRR